MYLNFPEEWKLWLKRGICTISFKFTIFTFVIFTKNNKIAGVGGGGGMHPVPVLQTCLVSQLSSLQTLSRTILQKAFLTWHSSRCIARFLSPNMNLQSIHLVYFHFNEQCKSLKVHLIYNSIYITQFKQTQFDY